jgi:predicted DNA-binding WGR domain protein
VLKAKLIRLVESKERYYVVSINPTLIGEWELLKVFGATRNKKPTGIVREYYASEVDAQTAYANTLKSKTLRGYIPLIFH